MPFLRYLKNGEYNYFEVPSDRMVIFGREEHVDFQILTDAGISREHFALECDESGKMVLIDLGSNNGTYINGKKLINDTTSISEGDEIKAGNQSFYYFNHKPLETMRPKGAPPIHQPAPPPAQAKEQPKSFSDQMKALVKSYNPNKNKNPGDKTHQE